MKIKLRFLIIVIYFFIVFRYLYEFLYVNYIKSQ